MTPHSALALLRRHTTTLALALAAASPAKAGGPALSPIAVRGDPLPGGVGVFSNFDTTFIRLNDTGRVAFLANVSGAPAGANQGVFTGTTAGTTEIALKNAPIPGGDGQFNTFTRQSIRLNTPGELVFRATLFGTSGGFTDDDAIFFHDGASLAILVREGAAAPEGTYSGFSNGRSVRLNDNSDVVFQCSLNNTDDPTFNDTLGIVLKSGASESFVAQGGDPAFGGPGDFRPAFDEDSVCLNNAAQTLFFDLYTGDGVISSNDSGFSRSAPDISALREGDALGGGTITGFNANNPQLNDSGDYAVFVSLSGVPADMNTGIVVNTVFALREGDAVPGAGPLTGSFSDHQLNNNTHVACRAFVSGATTLDDEIIVRAQPGGACTLVARENDLAPDGVSTIDVLFSTGTRLNNQGQIAFLARLNDAGDLIDAVLLYDDTLGLIELAREGDPLAGSTIQSIDANLALNELGQVAFTGALVSLGREFLALTDTLETPCAADLAEPFGQLDFSDVVAFLVAFAAMDPDADLAAPLGQFDFSDVVAFLTIFGAGCP